MFQSKKKYYCRRNPVTEALRQGNGVDKILLFKNASGDVVDEIRRLAKEQKCSCTVRAE
jgi:23S rRNA (guanosine2251-2'-O)-methyltransferase